MIFLPFQRWEGSVGALPAPHCPRAACAVIPGASLGCRQPWAGGGTALCSCPCSFSKADAMGVVEVPLPKAGLWHKRDSESVWTAGAQLAFICSYVLLLWTCFHNFLADPQGLIRWLQQHLLAVVWANDAKGNISYTLCIQPTRAIAESAFWCSDFGVCSPYSIMPFSHVKPSKWEM